MDNRTESLVGDMKEPTIVDGVIFILALTVAFAILAYAMIMIGAM